MCYNCGCGLPEDDMGHPESIIEHTFEVAAKASHQTVEEAKMETYKMLKEELEIHEEE